MVNQTYGNLEILLIDDGSLDDSYKICQKWEKRDGRIKCFHFDKAGGAVRARQKGITLSTADYVTYVDSDDWMESDSFEKLMDAILESYADISISTGMYNDYDGGCVVSKADIKEGVYISEEVNIILEKMIELKIAPSLVRCVYSKSKHMSYCMKTDERIRVNNDITCVLMTVAHADKIVVLDECLYHYQANPNSIVHSYRSDYLQSNCLMHQLVKTELVEVGKEAFLSKWRLTVLKLMMRNVRLECSLQNKVGYKNKMQHLKALCSDPAFYDLKQERNLQSLTKRNRTIWKILKTGNVNLVYIYLKFNALKCLVFHVSE
jgi:glycosyltransferase involved in cell wall biosynthesis